MSTFKTIHTSYGLQRNAQAEAGGPPVNLTHMAVGDGAGNPVIVSSAATQLARECFRAPLNRLYRDPDDEDGMYTAELVIPTSAGGFTLREVGVFDDAGALYLYGSLPDTYKPLTADGAFSDTIIRLKFIVANAAVVTLQANPNVAVATQSWVLNAATAASLLPGGTTGQVATKESNADGDIVWRDPDTASVIVDAIEETQVLAAGQTAVTLAKCTTRGLALYVNHQRVLPTEWTAHPTDLTRLTLAAAYGAGSSLLAVQNDPKAAIPTPLQQQLNLADVLDKAVARSNLGVYSKDEVNAMGFQPGMKAEFYRPSAPAGWLKCNGAAISRTAYAALFAAIGTTYGAGDGFNTFNVPDDRGNFARAWDDARGIDAGRAFGSEQNFETASHAHTAAATSVGDHAHGATASSDGSHSHTASEAAAGQHAHAASASAEGLHGHTAASSATGGHSHAYKDRYESEASGAINAGVTHRETMPTGYNANEGSDGTDNDNNTFVFYEATTATVGDHAHGITIDPAGTHSHTIATQDNGSHTHVITLASAGQHSHTLTVNGAGGHSHGITVNATGGAETRPRNRATLWCIKF